MKVGEEINIIVFNPHKRLVLKVHRYLALEKGDCEFRSEICGNNAKYRGITGHGTSIEDSVICFIKHISTRKFL